MLSQYFFKKFFILIECCCKIYQVHYPVILLIKVCLTSWELHHVVPCAHLRESEYRISFRETYQVRSWLYNFHPKSCKTWSVALPSQLYSIYVSSESISSAKQLWDFGPMLLWSHAHLHCGFFIFFSPEEMNKYSGFGLPVLGFLANAPINVVGWVLTKHQWIH